ncbi:MAG: hypothetical protein PVG49_19480 [Desulfobacteraceae bacterium]|jgi:hypothetical protein
MKLAFVLKEITYLKAYMPLIELWEKRHEIFVLINHGSVKPTNPLKHKDALRSVEPYTCKPYKTPQDIVQACEEEGTRNLITLEGAPFSREKGDVGDLNMISITHMTDFFRLLPWYYDQTRWVLFHSEAMSKRIEFDDRDQKFLFPGLPQYITLTGLHKEVILEKYGIPPNQKRICVLGPKKKFYRKATRIVRILCQYAEDRGYHLIYKTRKKDRVSPILWWYLKKFSYFYDISYHPHTTLELLFAADMAVNFDSSGIQDILMTEKPVVNFFTKPYRKEKDIYADPLIPDLPLDSRKEDIYRVLDEMMAADLRKEYRDLKLRHYTDEKDIARNYESLEDTIFV